jgi:hypothetical protein
MFDVLKLIQRKYFCIWLTRPSMNMPSNEMVAAVAAGQAGDNMSKSNLCLAAGQRRRPHPIG